MRTLIAALLAVSAGSTAFAATQQQCEALLKPIEARMEGMQRLDEGKATPQNCGRARDMISLYSDYRTQADKLGCPFAYVSGQKIGGAAERADLIAEMKQAYAEKCR